MSRAGFNLTSPRSRHASLSNLYIGGSISDAEEEIVISMSSSWSTNIKGFVDDDPDV